MSSDEKRILAYDLAGNWCEECCRAKSFRLWPGMLTGCKTCDEVVTRHRCTGLPAVTDRAPGQQWECPDCESFWTLAEERVACLDCCGECGHMVTSRRWELTEVGERIGSAPRYRPQPYTPLRNPFPRPAVSRPGPFGSCHRTDGGVMVHVKPGCRCRP